MKNFFSALILLLFITLAFGGSYLVAVGIAYLATVATGNTFNIWLVGLIIWLTAGLIRGSVNVSKT